VASTTLLMGRTPAALIRVASQAGEGPTVTPLTTAPRYRGQRSGSWTGRWAPGRATSGIQEPPISCHPAAGDGWIHQRRRLPRATAPGPPPVGEEVGSVRRDLHVHPPVVQPQGLDQGPPGAKSPRQRP
jgi:hypothetical protein